MHVLAAQDCENHLKKAKAKTSVILGHSLEGFHLQSHGPVLLG